MERLSYTKIDTYKKCPKQFMHIYVDKDVESKDSEALRYGEFLHGVLEDICEVVRANDNVMPDNISNIATETWKKKALSYRISPQLKEESRGIISSFGKVLRNNDGYKIIGNEHVFNMKIGEFTFTGKIDQVLERDDTMLIRDYKTNKEQKYLLQDPLQLRMYVLATAKELNMSPDRIMASFMFLRFNCDEEPKSFSSKELKETELWLESMGHKIKDSIAKRDFKPVLGPLCPYCPAIDKCPAAQSTGWIMKKYRELKAQGKV